MINSKISTDLESLDKLHKLTNWTPNSTQIRPDNKIIESKILYLNNILNFYETISDYILDIVFNYTTKCNKNGKLYIQDLDFKEKINFCLIKNKFPYKLNKNIEHYILWYPIKDNVYNENEISNHIVEEIERIFKKNLEYVWYENPKMSIPGLYHVQVFIKNSYIILDLL